MKRKKGLIKNTDLFPESQRCKAKCVFAPCSEPRTYVKKKQGKGLELGDYCYYHRKVLETKLISPFNTHLDD